MPPDAMCTLTFLKSVLNGKKKLMKITQIVGIPDIPRIKEINSSIIWNDIKNDAVIGNYFPDILLATDRTPDRTYMFSVLLTDFCCSFTGNLPADA